MANQTTTEAAPHPGTAYPVVLGPTFDGDHIGELLTMRLDFVPASANRDIDSKLQIDAETGTAQLSVPSTTDPSAPLEFQGPFTTAEGGTGGNGSATEGLDCVAVFDPTTQTFRLEVLHGHANLKYMPGSKRDKQLAQKAAAAPPPPAAAPAPAQAAVPEKKDLGPVEADFFHGGMD